MNYLAGEDNSAGATVPGEAAESTQPARGGIGPDPGRPPVLWRVFLVCLVFFLLVGAGVTIVGYMVKTAPKQEVAEPKERRLRVRILPLVRADIREVVKGYGTVRAFRESDVATEVSGKVIGIHPSFEPGGRVKKDAVLLRLDPEPFQLAHERTECLVRETEVELERLKVQRRNLEISLKTQNEKVILARDEYHRMRDSADKGDWSKSAIDARRLVFLQQKGGQEELENQKRLLDSTEARLKTLLKRQTVERSLAKRDLGLTEIRAPFDAEVVSRNVRLSARVIPSPFTSPLGRLMDPRTMEVPVEVPVSAAAFIPEGARVRMTCQALPGHTWECKVARRGPEADARARTVSFYVLIENDGKRPDLRPGMFVEAMLDGPLHENVVAIPRTALFGGSAFVADKEDRVRRRRPKSSGLTPELLRVEDGLAEGERLILNNLDEMVEGLLLVPEVSGDRAEPATTRP